MVCKGICHRHRAPKKKGFFYKLDKNNKRCTTCEINIRWSANFCPCCGYRLRKYARYKHDRGGGYRRLKELDEHGNPIEIGIVPLEEAIARMGLSKKVQKRTRLREPRQITLDDLIVSASAPEDEPPSSHPILPLQKPSP